MSFDRAMTAAVEMEVNRLLPRGVDVDEPGQTQFILSRATNRAKRIRRDRAARKRQRRAHSPRR